MAHGEKSPQTIRLVTALLLLATFAAGTVTGAGLCRWAGTGQLPLMPRPLPMMGPLPLQDLELSAQQRQQAHEILQRHHPELQAILHENYPRVRKVNQEIEREIREILTPEQRAKLDQLKARFPGPPSVPGEGWPGRPGPFGARPPPPLPGLPDDAG
jgi:Spy/CpxP family protein refolding chaperone